MPYDVKKDLINARALLKKADAILIVTGAGMSVDSGIPTYRGSNGIWTKSIQIGSETFSYDEISSLKMWKMNPNLAWGFKANFYKIMINLNLTMDIIICYKLLKIDMIILYVLQILMDILREQVLIK